MRLSTILSLFICVTVLFASCKKDVPEPVEPDGLVITIQEEFTTPPSRVSVFFKVETENNKPVSGLGEENFTIYEKGRNDDAKRLLSEDEATRIISDNSQVFRNHTMLILDLSGSVVNNSLEQTKAAAISFIEDVLAADVNSSSEVGVWWFDGADDLHSLIPFSNDRQALVSAVSAIQSNITTDNSTDLFGAILKGTAIAEATLTQAQTQDVLAAVSMIVFTDGTDQAARYAREDAYQAVEDASKAISYYTIGLGGEIDETVLTTLGPDAAVFADNTTVLNDKFAEIASLIFDEANSFYFFEYCTPKRDGSGVNDLFIHVEKDGMEGKRQTKFDATGFTNDCDLE